MTVDLHALEGFDQEPERDALRTLAARVPADLAIVELGTYKAKGTCFLAAGARDGLRSHVWTVDPWDLPGERSTTGSGPRPANPLDYTDPEIPRTARRQVATAELTEWVTFVQGFSEEVGKAWELAYSSRKVGLLFIDGDHREGAVRRDFAAWEPHLARGAVVAWDDHRAAFPGVINVVRTLSSRKHLLSEPLLIGSLAVTAKC